MTSNTNPGNFANRPLEDRVAAGIAGGHNEGPGSAAKHQQEAHEKVEAGLVGGGSKQSSTTGSGAQDDDADVEVEEYDDVEDGEEAEDGGGKSGGSGGGKKKRGFAAMPRERVQEIARKGAESRHSGGSSS